jgi:acyl carrier protein
MELIERELIELIVDTCNVNGPLPDNLSVDAPLFGPDSQFGLDSLDAVEVAVAIQKKYSKRVTDRNVMMSLQRLAAFIRN